MELVHAYKKLRRDFGKNCNFIDCKPELLVNIQPNAELSYNFIPREVVEASAQNVCAMSEHTVNTEVSETEHRGCLHLEGGWPKEIDPKSIEHVTRFRKKAERIEGYVNAVASLGPSVLHCINQNNAVDIYEEYFMDTPCRERMPPPTAKTIVTIRDPHDIKRPVSHLSWSPFGGRRIAVAHCALDFRPEGFEGSVNSYIWNVEEFNAPELKIKPHSPLLSLEFNPKDPTLVAGGCYNGQVLIWDTRRSGSSSIHTTPMDKSHKDPVYEVIWLQGKSGTECFSASTDGQICWWDTRYLVEPYESLTVWSQTIPGYAEGVVCLDYDMSLPTKFIMGTESGNIMTGNRKAKSVGDRIMNVYQGHISPVQAVHRHPFFPKFFISVADWTVRIWSEDCKESLMATPSSKFYLSDVCWSPVRPAVFFSSNVNGKIDVWDLVVKHNSPVLTMRVSDSSLTKLRAQEQGNIVATGSIKGTTALLELSDNLSALQQDEKQQVAAMFDRQSKHGKAHETRAKTAVKRVTARQRGASALGLKYSISSSQESNPDIRRVDREFFDTLRYIQSRREGRRQTSADADNFVMNESPLKESSRESVSSYSSSLE